MKALTEKAIQAIKDKKEQFETLKEVYNQLQGKDAEIDLEIGDLANGLRIPFQLAEKLIFSFDYELGLL